MPKILRKTQVIGAKVITQGFTSSETLSSETLASDLSNTRKHIDCDHWIDSYFIVT